MNTQNEAHCATQEEARDAPRAPAEPVRLPSGVTEEAVKKAARLRANGISEKSAALICKIPREAMQDVQCSDIYIAAYELACAQAEVKPVETEVSIRNLESIALRETISNVQSGLCDPATILDALKYATKVRLEERKLEQDRQQSFTANTQVVINLSDMLRGALERGMAGGEATSRTITFAGDSKSVTNGMDTEALLQEALGKEAAAKVLPKPHHTNTPVKITAQDISDLDDILVVGQDTGDAGREA